MGCRLGEFQVEDFLGAGSDFLVFLHLGSHDVRTLFGIEDCRCCVLFDLIIQLLDDVLIFEGVFEGGEHGVCFRGEGFKFFLQSGLMKFVVGDRKLLLDESLFEHSVLRNKSRFPLRVCDCFRQCRESVGDGGGFLNLHPLVLPSCDALVAQFLAEGVVFFTLELDVVLEFLDIQEQEFWDDLWNLSWTKTFCGGARGARVIGDMIGILGR